MTAHRSRRPDDWPDVLASLTTELDDCTAYVVTVADRVTHEIDAYGPLGAEQAVHEADQVLRGLRDEELQSVSVRVVRLHTVPAPVAGVGHPVTDDRPRRPATADASSSRTSAVVSQPMQASVTDCP
ncbi:hypothetical protein [Pseudonocardia abyssalis]|uniref:BON domain-containing protein n=1 Tax=Pseudonocardia abyssalis TaxID=2792008 RepID=A0ABS6UWW0_9PSEU|nr:hypothetical protein [Pseudonocardia abyssalis]MBW0118840.1 hypothetical protein [Pseudonocardia abyssalis]MBW0136481.1 hypothetical protein [Pseudonocardia abyssalis]